MIALHLQSIFHGANPYATDPVVVVGLDIADARLEAVHAAMGILQADTADWYRPGPGEQSQASRQRIGSFLADWSLQALTFVRGNLQAHGCMHAAASAQTLVWLGFHDPQISLKMLSLAARWLAALARQDPAPAASHAEELTQIWQICRQRHPDYQAGIVMQAARQRDIPWAPAWGLERHWRFGQGERSRVLFESASCADGHFGSRIANSKAGTKIVLRELGLPTPAFRLVAQESELADAVKAVGYPCVTKPLDRGRGKGVSAGLLDFDAVRRGFALARAESSAPVMVEAHVAGDDHRLMVVDGRLVAAIRRVPPSITGDGRHTVRELVAQKNAGCDPRSLLRSNFHSPVVLDPSALLHLDGQGLRGDAVLEAGRTIAVRSNANLSTGGSCIDVTAQLHPEIRVMAETLAQTLGIGMMGADYLCMQIDRSPADDGGQFIEINMTPGLSALVAAGWPIERAGELALGATPGRIAAELLIVHADRLEASLAALRSRAWMSDSGWASAAHAGIANVNLRIDAATVTTATTPWAGVEVLFSHRRLSRALIVASDREIQRHGLPLSRCEAVHLATELPEAWLKLLQASGGRMCNHAPDAWGEIISQWV
ncbi:putative D-alanine-D-alanine ligase and related ATP-grasp enzymes-like protein [Sterolibacterium denitrificans]|uniref:D-alanine-D-alanine ligase and related ATP-grasp enzymes-like protein n=1 Tax=Sterolibacterium denitrificans TaxID=157592 RepID=A0A7Z7HS23_9PROT|nr:ATP-grasp domain-containing protein [Sterolibacterium denitrificans]SMB27345.1 putative D-alanine-D-alanine ligase and related ATP-grasp enzymes-like protein [Sterolibacterium denitrificans]